MAEITTAPPDDPRVVPHEECWIRFGPSGGGGKVKKTSSLALPRFLAAGWERVADATGKPLAKVPGLPDAFAPGSTTDEPAAPASSTRGTTTSTTKASGGDA